MDDRVAGLLREPPVLRVPREVARAACNGALDGRLERKEAAALKERYRRDGLGEPRVDPVQVRHPPFEIEGARGLVQVARDQAVAVAREVVDTLAAKDVDGSLCAPTG